MKFPFTFFAAKPKTASSPREPQVGEKRRRIDSENAGDDPEPQAKRSRTTLAAEEESFPSSDACSSTSDDLEHVTLDYNSTDDTIPANEGNDKPGNDKPGNDKPGNDKPGNDKPRDDADDAKAEHHPTTSQAHASTFSSSSISFKTQEVVVALLTIFTAIFAISEDELKDWMARMRHSLARGADRLNVIRVWTTAIVGNLWRVICACAGS